MLYNIAELTNIYANIGSNTSIYANSGSNMNVSIYVRKQWQQYECIYIYANSGSNTSAVGSTF